MDKPEKLLPIGDVLGSHGLKGELKVRPYTERPENFYDFDEIIVKGKKLKITGCRVQKGKVFLFLERVTKRVTADKLSGETLYITRDQTSSPEEGEYFIIDLLGAQVLDEDSAIPVGTLVDVKQTGAVDNFEIEVEDKTILVPALKEYFKIVDTDTILARIPEEFFEL